MIVQCNGERVKSCREHLSKITVQICALNLVIISIGPVQLILVEINCQPIGPLDVAAHDFNKIRAGHRRTRYHGSTTNVRPIDVAFSRVDYNRARRLTIAQDIAHVCAYFIADHLIQLVVRVVNRVTNPIACNALWHAYE